MQISAYLGAAVKLERNAYQPIGVSSALGCVLVLRANTGEHVASRRIAIHGDIVMLDAMHDDMPIDEFMRVHQQEALSRAGLLALVVMGGMREGHKREIVVGMPATNTDWFLPLEAAALACPFDVSFRFPDVGNLDDLHVLHEANQLAQSVLEDTGHDG